MAERKAHLELSRAMASLGVFLLCVAPGAIFISEATAWLSIAGSILGAIAGTYIYSRPYFLPPDVRDLPEDNILPTYRGGPPD